MLEVGPEDLGSGELDAHGMDPTSVLASLGSLGGQLPRTFVVGCEPADVSEGMGLTPAVAAAADRVADIVTELLRVELALDADAMITTASSQHQEREPRP